MAKEKPLRIAPPKMKIDDKISVKAFDQLIKKLEPIGLASVSRTGVVAMTKGSEVYGQN